MNFWVVFLSFTAIAAMFISNYCFKRGMPFYLTRKIVHFFAAVPLLVSPLVFDQVYYPLSIGLVFLVLLVATHNTDLFPGFVKKGRLSEIFFPLSICISLVALWSVDPWAAVVPGLWLALGDGVTGLVRMKVNKREEKGWWGSLACLGACTGVAFLVSRVCVGVLGGCVATLAERFCGDAPGAIIKIDDNLAMPVAGLIPMVYLLL